MKSSVTDYALYSKRYFIGYTLLILLVIGLLVIAALYMPGSLRQGEVDSALTSGAMSVKSIDPSSVVNLPYYLLQRVGFMLLGVSTLTIKLPSIILGLLTIVGIFVLIKTWFRRNIAVIVTAIAVSAPQFMFLLQDGTPAIMFAFTTIWLLAASTFVTRARYFSTLWKVITCVLMATALYLPLGIYTVLALVITASLHPHIRYVIRRVARTRLIIAIILGLISISPLVYAIILQPSVALTLLGIPTGGIDLVSSFTQAGQNLFGFFVPSNSYLLRPMYSLGVTLLLGLGIYKMFTVKHTARSYAVSIIAAFLVPLALIDPEHTIALYPIAVIMIALGVAGLVADWYKLFPLNPYARAAGLLPISVVVAGTVLSGVIRYTNNYTYNPTILGYYSTDLRLLDQTLHGTKGPKTVVVTPKEQAFYGLVAHYDKRFTVSTDIPTDRTAIVTRAAYTAERPTQDISSIVTNARSNDSDRFYIYKTVTK